MNWFAKMIFDGRGKQKASATDSSRKYTLTTVCRFIKKQDGPAANCFRKLAGKLSLHSANQGSILIEFAVCMPVLIILLYYINDLSKLKRYYDQTEFVAQQMVNIIQNISQNREKITKSDIKHAASLAYLSIFPGTSRFMRSGSTAHVSDFGFNPLGYIFCVKGNTDSTASVLWSRRFHLADGTFDPSSASVDTSVKRTNVKILSNTSPSEIYPTLKINPGDIKIIIECAVHYSRTYRYSFTDGRLASQISNSQAFGLQLYKLSPPKTRDGKTNDAIFFHSVQIFKPINQGFFENPPQ